MVVEYGMSSKLGAVKYGTSDSEPFMGRDYGHQRDYSEDIAADIDAEVRNLIEGAHDEAWEILVQYRDLLDAMVLELAEKETLTKEDLERILAPVRKRPPHNSFSGFGKRTPSDRPPIEIPPTVRRPANGTNGANGSNGSNGHPNGWNQPTPAGANTSASVGATAPAGYPPPAPYGQPAPSGPAYGQPAYGTGSVPFGTQPGYAQPGPSLPSGPSQPRGGADADGFSTPQYHQPTGNDAAPSSFPPPPGYSYPERPAADPDGGARDEV